MQLGGSRLRHEIDRIPLWRGNHVGLKQLCEDVARYLYLPRVRDEDVIVAAVRDGLERLTWRDDAFAYAEGWDEQKGRYKGLRAGQGGRVVLDSECLLVKPDIAAAQLDAESRPQPTPGSTGAGPTKFPALAPRPVNREHGRPDGYRRDPDPSRNFAAFTVPSSSTPIASSGMLQRLPRRSSSTSPASSGPTFKSPSTSRSSYQPTLPISSSATSRRTVEHSSSTTMALRNPDA